MFIPELFKDDKVVFSCEIFPPKKDGSIDSIYSTLEQLASIKPDFISVTYGAGGSTEQKKTGDIASIIKHDYGIEPIAHLTCINSSREDILEMLKDLKEKGIENVLALRGDRNPNLPLSKDFKYAYQLVELVKECGGFNVSGACYPEGHSECESLDLDILHLKHKVDCGVTHLMSQLFFDNEDFYRFYEKTLAAGINVPIEAGIMPVVNKKQILRMVTLCGASLPKKFVKIINRFENNPQALYDAGVAYASEQIIDLVSSGVKGIHLYTMNKPDIAKRIYDNTKTIIRA